VIVQIENFQSIKKLELEVKNLTVIAAPNDTGKSAVYRAIFYCLIGMPGDHYVRNGTPYCKVRLKWDGIDLTWIKGSGKNEYHINGKQYLKVGRDVPAEVKALNFLAIGTGKKAVRPNFQKQLSVHSPFLIVEDPADVNRILNRLSRADEIGKAAGKCKSDTMEQRAELKVFEHQLVRLEDLLSSLQDVEKPMEDLAAKAVEIEGITSGYEDLKAAEAELELFDKTEELLNVPYEGDPEYLRLAEIDLKNLRELKEFKRIEAELEFIRKLAAVKVPDIDEIDRESEKEATLREYRDNLDRSLGIIGICEGVVGADLSNLEGKISKVEEMMDSLSWLKDRKDDLIEEERLVTATETNLDLVEKDLTANRNEASEFFKEHPQCPACGSDTTEEVFMGMFR